MKNKTTTMLMVLLSTTAIKAQHAKQINTKAPVQCSKTILINAKAERVWAVITAIDHWADWQRDISKPKLNGSLATGTTFDWKTGGARIHSTIHTVEPFHSFGWTGKTTGMYAIHNWTLTEEDRQTRVSVDESMEGGTSCFI
jgi:uncharacterized protein YndB with AHSA1/START domain